MSESFKSWSRYWGLLHEDPDPRFPSRVYGFENVQTWTVRTIPAQLFGLPMLVRARLRPNPLSCSMVFCE